MRRFGGYGALVVLTLTALTRDAGAVDLPKLGDTPIKLDVTETSIVAQRFEARDGENPNDQGYFVWLNRLNLVLGWKRFTLGARIDSSVYALRPEDRSFDDPQLKRNAIIDGATRYRNAVYPAKLWFTYKDDVLEATAGDSYVQFGRGLVLSLRKVDELGIDTTLFGGKITATADPFAVTLIAGIANPSRIDEPTGRSLLLPKTIDPSLGPQPIFGSDRIVGAQIQAGRGLPISLSTHAIRLTKCAPYAYEADGRIKDGVFDAPFGTCDDADRSTYLAGLPTGLGPVLASPDAINAGQSLEIPSLWGHGSIYVEGAVQRWKGTKPTDDDTNGNALYASVVTTGGPVANTLEIKSYRNFYPLSGGVNVSRASAFSNIQYSAAPTAETVVQDSMFGFFNTCVTGGRDRFDYRLNHDVLAYGTFGYFLTKSEIPGGGCDDTGRSTSSTPDRTTDHVTDASVGLEWHFDADRSIAFLNFTGRDDVRNAGGAYYRELAAQYSVTKYISGPYSVELSGRHRYRSQDQENIHDASPNGEPWWQGEHYTALKVAPKWVFSQGIEYTTLIGLPTLYINGGVLYRFTSQSNIRLYAGQNRGGLRCVSGICRVFPAFSGARAELTLRF